MGNRPKVLALVLRNRGNGDLKRSAKNDVCRMLNPCDVTTVGKSFGLMLHRYFRMRFCSANCLSAYQRRLDDLTMIKIQSLEQPRALPR